MFPEVDPVLGPEMKATGEVMGLGKTFGDAFFKAQQATGAPLPLEGTVLLTVADRDKNTILPVAKRFKQLGFDILATEGTSKFLAESGIENTLVKKLHEGRPNIADAIKNRRIALIINTPVGKESKYDDSYIRIASVQNKIPYITSVAAAEASVEGISAAKNFKLSPISLQDYYTELAAEEGGLKGMVKDMLKKS